MLEKRAGNRSPIREWESRPSGEKAAIEAEAQSRLQTSGYPQLRRFRASFTKAFLRCEGKYRLST